VRASERHGSIRAVVLAAGRGTRMRAASHAVVLDAEQERAADRGLKALVPFNGQPFLSYVLTALADAGYVDVCLVVPPGDDPIRACYEHIATRRLRLHFAVQEQPLGSAHALLAAESFAGIDDIAVINSDNLYPADALRALRTLTGSGLIGFRRSGLLRGNIDAGRIAGYALIATDETGALSSIIEKPTADSIAAAGDDVLVSMTCWRFRPGIFEAIRATPRSARGEYEIPDAVARLMVSERFDVVPMSVPVLDLSRRDDIPHADALLRGMRVDL
jgi:glucose-1-phosphate thymidylyltransferase